MTKKMVVTIIVLVFIFGGLLAFNFLRQFFINRYFATFVPPPVTISAVAAKVKQWQPYLYAVGTLKAVNGVELSSEVSGQIKAIYFKSGQSVKQGQPLIQLEDSTEQAQLKDIAAQLNLAQKNDERNHQLLSQAAISQSSVDDSSSKVKQLLANYESVRSQIAKKLIKAPFNGNIGIKMVNIGQYISPGFSCASLQSSHALNVEFSLPQQDVSKVSLYQNVIVTTDAYEDLFFKGSVTAKDSKIDEVTRTIQLQATIENTNNKLLPGMFVKVQVALAVIPNTIILPQTAVTYSLYGDSAFVISLDPKKSENGKDLGKVKRVVLHTGEKQGNEVVILEGIKAGDLVVDSGQLKLNDGDRVVIDNSIKL